MYHLHQKVLHFFSPGTTTTNSSPGPQRAFPSPPPPLPKREDWPQRRIELQPECMFLTKLPAEIRIMVYENVDWGEELARPEAPRSFDDIVGTAARGDSETNEDDEREEQEEENRNSKDQPLEKLRQTAHPLSLLLTSRQINREATPIAYANHTFTTTPHLNFLHALQHATSLLSGPQLAAISSLAYKFPQPPGWHITTPTHFLANALIHFPGLTRVTVIMQRVAEEMMPPETVAKTTYDDNGVRGTCHVPVWWDDILSRVVSGSVVRWQSGSKWSLHYTEDETPYINTPIPTTLKVDEETGKCYLTTVQWILRRCAELGLERPPLPPQPGVLQRRICASRVRLPPKIRRDVEYGSKVRRRDVLVGTRAEVRQEGSARRVRVGLEFWECVRVGRGVWAAPPPLE